MGGPLALLLPLLLLPLMRASSSSANPNGNEGRNPTFTATNPNDNWTLDTATANASFSYPFQHFHMKTAKSRSGRSVCKISEFGCKGGKCISSDKFCDGIDHCGDGSDEPRFCTPCNRTYYGEWGSTYTLSLTSSTIAAALGLTHEQQLLAASQSDQPKDEVLGRKLLSPKERERGGGGKGGGMRQLAAASRGERVKGESRERAEVPQFVCQLTFAAAGDNFGDFVQVMFDSVNIGHFTSPVSDGCPEGSLQVAEINRPLTGGKWCGSGTGYSVYFSETSAIALTLGLGVPSRPGGGNLSTFSGRKEGQGPTVTSVVNKPSGSAADEFQFKIRYKFIPRTQASVRFGSPLAPVERGEVVPGSYCSRDFEYCHRRRCKIQSPNYPGLYPRNLTCHYVIRHREKIPCKHVLLQVGQGKGDKVQLRGSGREGGKQMMFQEDALLAWDECAAGNRDSITIHDGSSTEDPVLLSVCGGSHIPPVTSSNSELLVVFRATPFGNPLEPKPGPPFPEMLRGFELDVDVVTVDSESAEYSNDKRNCTFFFVSQPSDKCLLFRPQEQGGNWISGRRGKVASPRHTIPPNTTCRYEFKGTKHEVVWIYFVTYSRAQSKDPTAKLPTDASCTSRLTIRDGIEAGRDVLLGSFCDTELPKLCDHKALQNESRTVRSCALDTESYISAGPRLILEQGFLEGTAMRQVKYEFHYEFVSRHGEGGCDRTFDLTKMKKTKGVVRTTDNVFDFGRGGKSEVQCSYNFLLGSYEGLKLTVKNSSFGDRPCRTLPDFETGRSACHYQHQGGGVQRSEVVLEEWIWSGVNVSANGECICSNYSGGGGPTFTFLGRRVRLLFRVEGMSAADSYENFFVHLEWEVVKGRGCRGDNHYMRTESGLIGLESTFSHGPKQASCETYPWLLEAKENHSLYLRIPGYPMIERVQGGGVGGAGNGTTVQVVLPSSPALPYNETNGFGENMTTNTGHEHRSCPTTKNRVLIYDGEGRLVQKICPASFSSLAKSSSQIVEIYSDDFNKFHSPLFPPPRTRFLVDFIGRELGSYQIKWLELISAKMKTTLKVMEQGEPEEMLRKGGLIPNVSIDAEKDQLRRSKPSWDEILSQLFESEEVTGYPLEGGGGGVGGPCPSFCPELKACISERLWCDGEIHCPLTKADEAQCDSFWATLNQLLSPAVYVPLAAAAVSAFCCCGLVILCVAVKRMVSKMREKGQLGIGIPSSASSRTSTVDRRVPQRDYFYDPHQPIS